MYMCMYLYRYLYKHLYLYTYMCIYMYLFLLKGRTQTASLNFLSASWLAKNPGLAGVAKGVQIYQDAMRDNGDPKMAFKSIPE